jgi:hypothetical protein
MCTLAHLYSFEMEAKRKNPCERQVPEDSKTVAISIVSRLVRCALQVAPRIG